MKGPIASSPPALLTVRSASLKKSMNCAATKRATADGSPRRIGYGYPCDMSYPRYKRLFDAGVLFSTCGRVVGLVSCGWSLPREVAGSIPRASRGIFGQSKGREEGAVVSRGLGASVPSELRRPSPEPLSAGVVEGWGTYHLEAMHRSRFPSGGVDSQHCNRTNRGVVWGAR